MFAVEVLALRSELQRVAELMQGYMQRERQLHEMMEQLTNTYQEVMDSWGAPMRSRIKLIGRGR